MKTAAETLKTELSEWECETLINKMLDSKIPSKVEDCEDLHLFMARLDRCAYLVLALIKTRNKKAVSDEAQ